MSYIHKSTLDSSSANKSVFIDLVLWVLSVAIGIIPVISKQLFFPSSEFKEMSLFLRLLSDMSFAYAFLTGGIVLTIQILLTIPRNNKNPTVTKFITGLSIIFYFIFIVLYNVALLFDYNSVEILLQNGNIGSVKEANIITITTTLITSFMCGLLHSTERNMGLHKLKLRGG